MHQSYTHMPGTSCTWWVWHTPLLYKCACYITCIYGHDTHAYYITCMDRHGNTPTLSCGRRGTHHSYTPSCYITSKDRHGNTPTLSCGRRGTHHSYTPSCYITCMDGRGNKPALSCGGRGTHHSYTYYMCVVI